MDEQEMPLVPLEAEEVPVETLRESAEGGPGLFLDAQRFEQALAAADMLARSDMVPKHHRGKTGNMMIILNLAARFKMDPFMLMQGIYIISGKPAMDGKTSIGLANASGKFLGPIDWRIEGEGPDMRAVAFATIKETGKVVEVTVSMKMAKAEGWTRNAKWQTMPEQMLRWRSGTWLVRLYSPECLMGLTTVSEAYDIQASRKRQRRKAAPVEVEVVTSEHDLKSGMALSYFRSRDWNDTRICETFGLAGVAKITPEKLEEMREWIREHRPALPEPAHENTVKAGRGAAPSTGEENRPTDAPADPTEGAPPESERGAPSEVRVGQDGSEQRVEEDPDWDFLQGE